MKTLLFNLQAVQTGTYKAEAGELKFFESLGQNRYVVLAPQHCIWVRIIDWESMRGGGSSIRKIPEDNSGY